MTVQGQRTDSMIRVLVVDDHRMFAESVSGILGQFGDFEMVATEGTGADAVRSARELRPDVAIVDFRLPDLDGPEVARQMIAASPSTKVLMLTGVTDELVGLRALEAGCVGFIIKGRAIEELAVAIRLVAAGESYIPAQLLEKMLPRLSADRHGVGSELSKRELEILELLRTGASTREIATDLYITPNTVRNHVQNIMTRLGAHSRIEAVAIATRKGLFETRAH